MSQIAIGRLPGRTQADIEAMVSNSLTGMAGQQEMNAEFTRTIFGAQQTRLGDAIRQAKTATADPFARRSWILLGDPSMKVVK